MTDTEGVEAVEGLVFVFHIIVEEGARGLELLDAMSPQGILNYWTVEFFFFFWPTNGSISLQAGPCDDGSTLNSKWRETKVKKKS